MLQHMSSFEKLLSRKREELSSAWIAFFGLLREQLVPVPELYVKRFYAELERPAEEKKIELLQTLEDIYRFFQELLSREVRESREKFEVLLAQAQTHLQKLAALKEQVDFLNPEYLRDEITDLWNEKALKLFFRLEVMPRIYEEDFVLVLFDINNFKALHRTYGEEAARDCLRAFAEFLKSNFKGKDFIARFRDDHFVVIMRDAVFDKARIFLESIYPSQISFRVKKEGHVFSLNLTFSMGFTNILGSDTLEEVLSRARQSLYLTKEAEKLQGIKV